MTNRPNRIGRYEILHKLGHGGMGVVYCARDPRLDRLVAIKMMRDGAGDAQMPSRFLREARAAAAINHPHVCQVYEVGEDAGRPYLAMELLQGETLAERIARGALPPAESVQIALQVLSALEALHAGGLIHRDLKPANVFITAQGVKVLDFGLAKAMSDAKATAELLAESLQTQPGMFVGTPYYSAPERLAGHEADERSDLFSVGAILYEMLAGKRPFQANGLVELLNAIQHEAPAALGGSPAVAAIDRVIHRALAKNPADRFAGAAAMATELRTALLLEDSGPVVLVKPLRRLIVLPFRVLRPDRETDFLAYGLADAITMTLAGLNSLVVRSPLAVEDLGGKAPDIRKIGRQVDVDVVLTGTLLRAGDQVRVTTHLVEAAAGTVISSHTLQARMGNLFHVQDGLVRGIIESLQLALTPSERKRIRHDVPVNAHAYQLYLRAGEIGRGLAGIKEAMSVYEQCVAEDPGYAPAWAQLGRCYRLLPKYWGEAEDYLQKADAAFQKALELNPDLPLAHHLYTGLQTDAGQAMAALRRLLLHAKTGASEPELFAGLVHVCRYCGLLRASLAAHENARRLDPNIATTVIHTYFASAEYERALEHGPGDAFTQAIALATLGRHEESLSLLQSRTPEPAIRLAHLMTTALGAVLSGRLEEASRLTRELASQRILDPEGMYYLARAAARLGDSETALGMLAGSVGQAYYCVSALEKDPWLDSLRGMREFNRITRLAETGRRRALDLYLELDGERVLGAKE